jgi:hypothetical protein
MDTLLFGMPKWSETNPINSAFALPSTGGDFSRALYKPSVCLSSSEFFARVCTLTSMTGIRQKAFSSSGLCKQSFRVLAIIWLFLASLLFLGKRLQGSLPDPFHALEVGSGGIPQVPFFQLTQLTLFSRPELED